MSTNFFFPIGFVDQHEDRNLLLSLARPDDAATLTAETPVVIWNCQQDALARCQAVITEVGQGVAAALIVAEEIEPEWPATTDPWGPGNPVYLAIPGSWHADWQRRATPRELDEMLARTRDYQAATGIIATAAIYTRPSNHDLLPHC